MMRLHIIEKKLTSLSKMFCSLNDFPFHNMLYDVFIIHKQQFISSMFWAFRIGYQYWITRTCKHCAGKIAIWATAWQINEMTCAPSEDSDQPGHPSNLIRIFTVHFMDSQGPKASSCGQRRLIRLGGCACWSESSLGAQVILFVLSCSGSYEPRHEKTWLRGVWPSETQTGLLSSRD